MSNEFWEEFNRQLVHTVPEELEYRVHYNAAGDIYMCTMQQHPNDTEYLVVTKEQYDTYFKYHVIKGQLKKIDTDARYCVQLQRSTSGYAVAQGHASLIIEAGDDYPHIEYYARTN